MVQLKQSKILRRLAEWRRRRAVHRLFGHLGANQVDGQLERLDLEPRLDDGPVA